MPTGTTEKQLNSHYQAGALDTLGVDAGYQINEKTKATVGYYHQNGDVGETDGSGVTTGLSYDINQSLTAGVKVSYDDAFETRVMATVNYTFGNLIQGDEEEKEARVNWLMNALSASPEQRDVRVHDGPILWKITMTPEGQRVMMAIDNQIYGRCDPPPQPECIHSDSECGDMYGWEAPCRHCNLFCVTATG